VTTAPRTKDGPIRVGVVGLGWAGEQHMKAYAARDDVALVAIAGLEDDRRAELSATYDVPTAVARWEDMLAAGGLDAISIAVPTFLHAPIAVAALEAGLHVLTEKPIASNATEADEMVATARRTGRVLDVVFNHRHRGDVSALLEQTRAGKLGRVYHARAHWERRAGIPTIGSWFTTKAMAGGGPLIDLGVHVLDYTLQLMGEPRVLAVSAVTHAELGPRGLGGSPGSSKSGGGGTAYEVEDLAVALLRLEGGASIALESSWATHRTPNDEFGVVLYGTDAGAEVRVVDYADPTTVRVFSGPGDGSEDVDLPQRESEGHGPVVDGFVSAIADPTSWAAHDGALGAERARIIEACYLSAERGAEVILDELRADVPEKEVTR
jgi:predicted dehydrogenase